MVVSAFISLRGRTELGEFFTTDFADEHRLVFRGDDPQIKKIFADYVKGVNL